jgi:hypothetical protein
MLGGYGIAPAAETRSDAERFSNKPNDGRWGFPFDTRSDLTSISASKGDYQSSKWPSWRNGIPGSSSGRLLHLRSRFLLAYRSQLHVLLSPFSWIFIAT